MFKHHRKRRVVASAVTLGIVASVALAAWLTSGTGTGRAQAGSLQALTVEAGTNAPNGLYPGQTGDVAVKVTNPNSQALVIQSAAYPPGEGDDSGSNPQLGCPANTLSFNSVTGLSIPLPPGTTEVIIPGGATLHADAPTQCQNADYRKPYRLVASTP